MQPYDNTGYGVVIRHHAGLYDWRGGRYPDARGCTGASSVGGRYREVTLISDDLSAGLLDADNSVNYNSLEIIN